MPSGVKFDPEPGGTRSNYSAGHDRPSCQFRAGPARSITRPFRRDNRFWTASQIDFVPGTDVFTAENRSLTRNLSQVKSTLR